MGAQSKTLRDLWASVIYGSTVNVQTDTATDLVRSVITDTPTTTPYSYTDITYNVSGYTVPQDDTNVLIWFYVDSGATMQTLLTGDTLLSTYISSAVPYYIPSGITVSEIITTTTGNTVSTTSYLNININGTANFPGDVNITGNLHVSGNTVELDQYIVSDLFVNSISPNSGQTGITFTSNVIISDNYYIYFGDPGVSGCWRVGLNATDLSFEIGDGAGNWTQKGAFQST